MPNAPIVYRTTHLIRFSDLDLYNHVSTAHYAAYYIDHRMQGLRENLGWDQQALATLPFMVWVRRLEIDFIRPVRDAQEITVTSFVRELQGHDAFIECTMLDGAGKVASRCLMIVAFIDRATNRSADWPPDVAALFFAKD